MSTGWGRQLSTKRSWRSGTKNWAEIGLNGTTQRSGSITGWSRHGYEPAYMMPSRTTGRFPGGSSRAEMAQDLTTPMRAPNTPHRPPDHHNLMMGRPFSLPQLPKQSHSHHHHHYHPQKEAITATTTPRHHHQWPLQPVPKQDGSRKTRANNWPADESHYPC